MRGADTLAHFAFTQGAKAAVWGAANLTPHACVDLYRAVAVDGDLDRGREIWRRLWPVMDTLKSPRDRVRGGGQVRM